jgi:hypothetical protein
LAEAILGGCRKTDEERLAEIYGPPRQRTYRGFESWSALAADSIVDRSVEHVFDTLAGKLVYETNQGGWVVATQSGAVGEASGQTGPGYSASGLYSVSNGAGLTNLASIGHAGLDVVAGRDPFTGSFETAVVANPYALGWNYQSFGAWDEQAGEHRLITSKTYGAPTTAGSIPPTGNATFTGTLGGFYVSPAGQKAMAAADLTVAVDFEARSLDLSSGNTRTTGAAAAHLDLRGTLTYAAGTNRFSGTLANVAGTMSGASTGRFYGPAAQELGGVFNLKASGTPETFAGAYGAKR